MRRAGARWVWLWVAAAAWLLRPAPLLAAEPSLAARPARAPVPTLSVLTFGPGDETFSKFGHDALWVHDPRQPPKRRDLVFNYGTFRFDSPWLILTFLQGKLQYWLSVSSLERTLASYRAANRSVSAQELALSDERALAITAFLHENVKPENAYYRYDYYRDNCATRIRDLLDGHLGGLLKAGSAGPGSMTYREHTRRMTVGSPVLFFALDLALGPLVDRPVSQWEEMFLPARVEAKLDELQGDGGAPLVRRRSALFEAAREAPLDGAPGFRWGWLAAGLAIGAALCLSCRFEQRWARVSTAFGLAALGFAWGLLGLLLLVLWLLTDHEVVHWNQNVLLCPVWASSLPFFARGFARSEPRASGLMMRLVGAAALSALLALLLRLLPGSQHTGPALSFFVPQWLGAGFAVWTRVGRPVPRWLAPSRADQSPASHPPAPVDP